MVHNLSYFGTKPTDKIGIFRNRLLYTQLRVFFTNSPSVKEMHLTLLQDGVSWVPPMKAALTLPDSAAVGPGGSAEGPHGMETWFSVFSHSRDHWRPEVILSTTKLDSQGDSLVQEISPAPRVPRVLTLDDKRGLLHEHSCLVLGKAAEFPLRLAA